MSNEKVRLVTNREVQDVATDLTMAFIEKYSIDKEEVAEVYKLFFKTAIEAFNGQY